MDGVQAVARELTVMAWDAREGFVTPKQDFGAVIRKTVALASRSPCARRIRAMNPPNPLATTIAVWDQRRGIPCTRERMSRSLGAG